MLNLRRKLEKKKKNPFVIKSGDFRHGKLEKHSHLKEWVENSFVFGGKQSEIVGLSFDFSKIKLIVFFILFFILVLFTRIFFLQIINGDYYRGMAEGNRIRERRVEAKRGIIYDRNNKPLVRNVANFLLYFVPADLPRDEQQKNDLIEKIANILFPEEVEEKDTFIWKINQDLNQIESGSLELFRPLFIIDDIEYEKAIFLILNSSKMPGVVLSNDSRREYLNEDVLSLSHILGYTGKISPSELENKIDEYSSIDYIGKAGVEYFWENELKGKSGNKRIEVDALGHEKKIISREEVRSGYNLVLSVDYDLQKKIEEITAKYLKNMGLKKASVIAMDPSNGEILSLVSFPFFNNNLFAQGISKKDYKELISREDKPLFNRSISGEYPSGSTIKPVIAVVALEEKVISENTSFLSVGGIRIKEWFFPDWRAGGHGITNVRKALADSVNTFFYYIGGGFEDFSGLGGDRIVKYLRLFGLGRQTGIDLIGESAGFVPSKKWKEEVKEEAWYIGDTYHLAIGQGDVLVTPLQVANYTSFFANGGKLYQPHLVKDILSENDNLVESVNIDPVKEDFIDSYNIEVVRQGMRQGVTSGSSRRLLTLPVTSAGKTGTAQWSSKKDPHAWWTGFAPYKDPEIVLTVMVEEGIEGSQVGVSIAYEILAYYFDKNR